MNNNRRKSLQTKCLRSAASVSQLSIPRRQCPHKNISPPGSADSTMSSASEKVNPLLEQEIASVMKLKFLPEDPTADIQASSSLWILLQFSNAEQMEVIHTPKPPAIFIRRTNIFWLLCTQLDDLVGKARYFCVSRLSDTKILADTPGFCRSIVRYLEETQTPFHTN